jgi:hypothetical protein
MSRETNSTSVRSATSSAERAAFYQRYYDTIAGEKANVDARLARLAGGAG